MFLSLSLASIARRNQSRKPRSRMSKGTPARNSRNVAFRPPSLASSSSTFRHVSASWCSFFARWAFEPPQPPVRLPLGLGDGLKHVHRLKAHRGHHILFADDVVQPSTLGVDRHGAVAQARAHPVDPLLTCALAAARGRRGCRLRDGCSGFWLRGDRALHRASFRQRHIGSGHGRPALERQADPALRLLGDRAKLARAVAEIGGEGAERIGLLAEPGLPRDAARRPRTAARPSAPRSDSA